MARKALKSDDLIDALSEEKILKALSKMMYDQIRADMNNLIDNKLEKMKVELTTKIQETMENFVEKKSNEMSSKFQHQIDKLEDRVNQMETRFYQNELLICGHNLTNKSGSEIGDKPLIESVRELIKSDLNIQLLPNDINYTYVFKNKHESSVVPPILVNFSSVKTKNDLLQKVRQVRKLHTKNKNNSSPVYYNERLTKRNQQIFYQTRNMAKNKQILSTWIFKGEIYIKKDQTSAPQKIDSATRLEGLNGN